MKRTLVLSLCLAGLAVTGGSALAAGPGVASVDKAGQVCVVVWNDPNSSGRDGVCVVAPSIVPKP